MHSEQPQSETILFLIRQELKLRRLFDGLHRAGFDDCYFEPQLDTLVLQELGLDEATDETMNWYSGIIEKSSQRIDRSPESIRKESMKVFETLVAEKNRRKNQ